MVAWTQGRIAEMRTSGFAAEAGRVGLRESNAALLGRDGDP